jgi:Zn-dependent peptidase ImmA (M78 family)
MKWTARARIAAKRLLTEQGIQDVPVDVKLIAENLGIMVIEEDLEEEISGMLSREGERAVMLIHRGDVPQRKRFSIAHEIGHFVMHKDPVFVDRRVRFRDAQSSLGVNREEIEANSFAAELLMPYPLVMREVSRRQSQEFPPSDEDLIAELARQFDVSRQAIELRLSGLGMIGTM